MPKKKTTNWTLMLPRLPVIMKRRARLKLACLALVVIILYLSFKILEPDIRRSSYFNNNFIRNSDDSSGASDEVIKSESRELRKTSGTQREEIIRELIEQYRVNYEYQLVDSPWVVAAQWIRPREIVPAVTPELGAILKTLNTAPIVSADVGYRGTQLKLSLVLEGGQKVAFKPQWYSRDYVVEGSPYAGKDRHNGEIVSFHLNRLLEFCRGPIVVGRRVNLKTEIIPVAQKTLLSTFFTKDNNLCFYGKCYYCKGEPDGVCANKDVLEGVLVLWFPSDWLPLQLYKSPWARTYREGKKARWETDDAYCGSVLKLQAYKTGPLLLDLIDAAIFDYLIGNADRHHYETFMGFPHAALLLLDSAKSFGDPYHDEHSILAPLYQCCQVRVATWKRLLNLQEGILSDVMRGILDQEPVAPVLAEPHFDALDRRLKTILDEIDKCFHKLGVANVLIEHG